MKKLRISGWVRPLMVALLALIGAFVTNAQPVLYGGLNNNNWTMSSGIAMTATATSGVYYKELSLSAGDIWAGIGYNNNQYGNDTQDTAAGEWKSLTSGNTNAPKLSIASAGTYTFLFNTNNGKFKYVSGSYSADLIAPTVAVAGAFNSWSTTANMLSMTSSGIYEGQITLSSAGEIKFVYNDNLGNSDQWTGGASGSTEVTYFNYSGLTLDAIGSGSNIKICGTGTLDVTVNLNNSTFSLSQPTAYVYNVYVKNTGSNDAPYLYAYDGNDIRDNYSTSHVKDWAGVQGSTTEVVNTYTYYKFTFTSTSSSLKVIANMGDNSNQTDGITVAAGNYYIEFDGTAASNITPSYSATTPPAAPVANSLVIHVLNKVQGTSPWLWVYDTDNVTSAWPGDQMSLTETINGETWHKMTVSTYESTVKAGVMFKTDGNVTWQTPDIQNIDATAGDWYIVVDTWLASNTDNVSCTYSSATAPAAAQQHNSNWYVHGNFAAATATGDAAWSHANAMSTTDYTVYTWQVNLKSGYNYYFFPSDISSSVWTDINDGHRWAYYDTEQSTTVTGNSTIALNTWVPTRAQSTDANLHYYCESTSLHTIYFNAKTGEVKIEHETIDPTSDKLYLIGLARDNNDPDHVGNEWAANLGIEMTKGTDAYGEYFYATNINLLSFNSGFAFATKLGSDRDDWTTVNACRYGSIVNSGDQLVLYNENIETDVEIANDVYSSTDTKWIELYPVGQSRNTFTIETDGAYDIKFYKGDGTTANPPRVKLYRSDFPDAMYIIGGTISSWSDHKGVKMTRDTEATDEVFTTTTAFDIGATLAFSMRIGNWDLINQHRLGSASAADGDTGYWITSGDNGNIGTEIALANYDSSDAAWTSGSKHNFNIQTNKSGVFNVTVNVTQKWVKFEQIREVQGHTVLVHLEKTDDITSPQLFAWDKETREDGSTRISVDRPTFTALTTQRKVLTVHENEVYTTTVDGREWYTWTIDNNIAEFIITRGGKALANVTVNGTDTDTDDTDATLIEWRRSGEIFLHWNADGSLVDYTRDYDTYQAQEAPTETKMIDGHYYVYFINTMKWPKSYIYAWFNNPSTNENEPLVGGYPGKVLTDMVCYDGAGNEVWLFDFGPMSNFEGREPTGLLFSVGDGTGGMQTGDFEFVNGAVYDYSGSVVLGRDLANIIVNGEADGLTRYIIEDDLVAAYFDTKEKMLYCKDLNKFKTTPYVARSVQQDGQLDYVRDVAKRLHGQMAASRYDQSNWVRLKIHDGAAYALTNDDLERFAMNHNVLKAGTVRGVLTNKINPTMELVNLDDGTAIQTNGTSTYTDQVNPKANGGSTINVYTTANFNGSQASASGREYFFVTPKPCEYCNITWAVCTALEGNTATFTIPKAKYMGENEFDNQGDLKGNFTANISNTDGAASLEIGEVYTFQAIIELDESAFSGSGSGAPRKRANTYAGGEAGNNAYPYVVKPVSVSGVVTEVRDLNSDKKVTGVNYVNMAGQTASKPFDGVNIVVTTYSDGSRSAVKVIR
ncbi:MAG: hypothetical protein IJU62_04065 [Muribaculaceae bacterium]|nr:hypothetical protein [Muribaculaceae bacterium]